MAKQLILIVEDNDKNLKLLRDVLGSRDYVTTEAITAEEGLKLAQSQQPALILMGTLRRSPPAMITEYWWIG